MKFLISHRAKPLATRAKAFAALGIATSCLWVGMPASLCAATYSVELDGAGAYQWATAPWVGTPDAYPGAGDTADITKKDGQNTTLDLLAGTVTIANLTYDGGTNQLRLRNHNSANESLLRITAGLSVGRGTLVLAKQGSGHRFALETASAEVASGAILRLGISTAGVAFQSDVTTIQQGGAVEIYSLPTDGGYEHNIHFGTLTNNGTLDLLGGSVVSTSTYGVSASSISGLSTGVITTLTTGAGASPKPVLHLTGGESVTATYAGVISDGAGVISLSKEGSGTQVFSNANTYSGGTAITGGVLVVTNASGSGLGTGRVDVSDQGVLAGSGVVALSNEAIHLDAGGSIAPGALGGGGFSVLHLSGANTSGPVLVMDDDTAFTFQLGAGNASDQVQFLAFNVGDWVMNGSGGVTINATGGEVGGVYTLFTFLDGNGDAIGSGLTGGLVAGAGLEGFEVRFHYGNELGDSGYGTITMEITQAIPEPGAVGLMLLGGAWFLGSFRLRGRKAL